MSKWFIGVIIAVALVVGVLPPVFGFIAEDRFKAAVAEAPENPQFDVIVTNYERGLFRSTALITVQLDRDFAASLDTLQEHLLGENPDIDRAELTQADMFSRMREGFEFNVDVLHGPVSFSEGLFWGLSRSTTLIAARDGELREFQDKAQLPYLLRVRADMSLTGATDGVVDVPAFTYMDADVTANFSGFDAVSSFQPSTRLIDYAGSVTALDIVSPAGALSMSDMSTSGAFEFVSDVFSPGSVEMLIKSMRVDAADAAPIVLSNLGFDALLSLDSAGEYAGIELNYLMDEVSGIEGHTLSDARLNMSFRQLDFAALERYLRVSQNLNILDPESAQQGADEMAASMHGLLLGSPTVAMEPLQFSFDGQPFNARINIDFDGSNVPSLEQLMAQMQSDPMLLLNLMSGAARIEVAEPLGRIMAAEFTRNQLAASVTPDMGVTQAEIDAAAERQSIVVLSGLIAQGMFMVEDDTLISDLNYSGGLLTINGMPIPLGPPQ